MNLFKRYIDEIVKHQKEAITIETELKRNVSKEDVFQEKIRFLGKDFKFNESVIKIFIDHLQLINNPKTLEQFSLDDISKLYEILLKLSPDNIGYYEEFIWFVFNVLDDEKKALKLIKKVQTIILKKQYIFDDITKRILNKK